MHAINWFFMGSIVSLVLFLISYRDLKNYPNSLTRSYVSYGLHINDEDPSQRAPDSITPIVMIPGLDGAVSFFSDVIPELTYYQHPIIVFHLPLLTTAVNEADYTFEYIAGELKKLVVDKLHVNKFHLIGESFGGIIAQHVAFSYPQHVDRLVMVSSLAKTELPADIQWKLDNLFPIIYNLGKWFPSIAQYLFAQIHVSDVCEDSDPQFIKDLFIKEASFAHFFSVMRRIIIASQLDIVERTKLISAKTLIVYGLDDHFTKKDAGRLHELIKSSRLIGMPGGHLAHVTAPKLFANHVHEFLNE